MQKKVGAVDNKLLRLAKMCRGLGIHVLRLSAPACMMRMCARDTKGFPPPTTSIRFSGFTDKSAVMPETLRVWGAAGAMVMGSNQTVGAPNKMVEPATTLPRPTCLLTPANLPFPARTSAHARIMRTNTRPHLCEPGMAGNLGIFVSWLSRFPGQNVDC